MAYFCDNARERIFFCLQKDNDDSERDENHQKVLRKVAEKIGEQYNDR
jgi:cAMP phosphodiesterase